MYIRYFKQGNHHTYGHIQCTYTVPANPAYNMVWNKSSPATIQACACVSKPISCPPFLKLDAPLPRISQTSQISPFYLKLTKTLHPFLRLHPPLLFLNQTPPLLRLQPPPLLFLNQTPPPPQTSPPPCFSQTSPPPFLRLHLPPCFPQTRPKPSSVSVCDLVFMCKARMWSIYSVHVRLHQKGVLHL